jgi:PadR family transcriptional regulator, regulatory protein PadR
MPTSMADRSPYRNRIELLQGTLDLLILQTLCAGPLHGYAITQAIRSRSAEALQVDTGSLYPALHRLEKKRSLKASWGLTENKQRARFYELTAAGRKQLVVEHARWLQIVEAIGRIVNPAPETGRA